MFDALNLPLERVRGNPHVRFRQLAETQRALRDVLEYRLYRDLRRGGALLLPNLSSAACWKSQYTLLTRSVG